MKILSNLDLAGSAMSSVSRIELNAAPTEALQVARRQDVIGKINGLNVKKSCRVATLSNIANLAAAGVSIDGVTVVAGDRVLLRAQTTAHQNGIYSVSSISAGSQTVGALSGTGQAMVQVTAFSGPDGTFYLENMHMGAGMYTWTLKQTDSSGTTLGNASNVNWSNNGTITINGNANWNGNSITFKMIGGAGASVAVTFSVSSSASTAVLARAEDADTNSEVAHGDFVMIEEGTKYSRAGFVLQIAGSDAIALGTTELTWQPFVGGAQTLIASGGLVKDESAKTISMDTISAGGSKKSKLNINSKGLVLTFGETVYRETITMDGSMSTRTITHNLNLKYNVVQVFDMATDKRVIVDVTATGENSCTLTFASVPANGAQFKVVVLSK